MYDSPIFLNAGVADLVVEFGDTIDVATNRKVQNLFHRLRKLEISGVVELVPTYRSLLVSFDPRITRIENIQQIILESDNQPDSSPSSSSVVMIPTLYGGEYGPDIDYVAANSGMTTDGVISIHAGTDYLVYMMGFSPGFPYLGGLDRRLATGRLESPRSSIPAGSVGIADDQTGVYPISSPGGWRLIGRTPIVLFDPETEPPTVINAGDYVRFVPLKAQEDYLEIEQQIKTGEYKINREYKS